MSWITGWEGRLQVLLWGVASVSWMWCVARLWCCGWGLALWLVLYCILFLFHSLRTYSVLNHPPSMPSSPPSSQLPLVFQNKNNQQQKRQTIEALKYKPDISLHLQYVQLLCQPSFCDHCEQTQPPRAQHCFQCQACILHQHLHDWTIGHCIGSNNQIPYLIHLCAAKLLCAYSLTSKQFDKLSAVSQVYFLILEVALLVLLYFYSFRFFTLLPLIQTDLTIPESNDPFLLPQHHQLLAQPTGSPSYLNCLYSVFVSEPMGEVSAWISEAQDQLQQIQ